MLIISISLSASGTRLFWILYARPLTTAVLPVPAGPVMIIDLSFSGYKSAHHYKNKAG